mmetsp:Transcript_884/g.1016  ORF Transcript_884/g.1016 Transcript_884/m.1016 type:complete len:158 (-) Transcript_884:85-558(-)
MSLLFPGLGKHCHVEDCKELDFLPYTCKLCKEVFCGEHRHFAAHKCAKISLLKDKKALACPLCSKPLNCLPGQDRNTVVSKHIDGGCKDDNDLRHKCSKKRCKKFTLVPINCPDCHKHFCVSHRSAERHSCKAKRPTIKKPLRNGVLHLSPLVQAKA